MRIERGGRIIIQGSDRNRYFNTVAREAPPPGFTRHLDLAAGDLSAGMRVAPNHRLLGGPFYVTSGQRQAFPNSRVIYTRQRAADGGATPPQPPPGQLPPGRTPLGPPQPPRIPPGSPTPRGKGSPVQSQPTRYYGLVRDNVDMYESAGRLMGIVQTASGKRVFYRRTGGGSQGVIGDELVRPGEFAEAHGFAKLLTSVQFSNLLPRHNTNIISFNRMPLTERMRIIRGIYQELGERNAE